MEELFTNYNEYIDFLSAKAHQRIGKLSNTNKKYDYEIDEAIAKCDEIFKSNGVETNYIDEIIAIEMQMQSKEDNHENSNDLDELALKRESLYKKYDAFLETLSLSLREDLEFNFKKIIDRKLRSNHTNDLIAQIEEEFPKGVDLTVTEIMEQPTFKKANEVLHIPFTNELETKEETVNLPYVVQIKKAPENLLHPDMVELPEELPIEKTVNVPVIDFEANKPEEEPIKDIPNLFDTMSDFNFEDKIVPSFNELPEQKTDKIEAKEDLVLPSFEEEPEFEPFTGFNGLTDLNIEESEKNNEPEKLPETIEQSKENENTYTMDNGDSLASIAYALIDDENGWYDIFEANKDKLIQRMQDAGLTQNDDIQYNEEVFSGITLTIPNVYEKNSAVKGLAA